MVSYVYVISQKIMLLCKSVWENSNNEINLFENIMGY